MRAVEKPSEKSPNAATSGAKPIAAAGFNHEEIRRTIELGRERGLIKGPSPEAVPAVPEPKRQHTKLAKIDLAKGGVAIPVAKDGTQLSNLGNVRSMWMDVSPDKAREWLKNNFGNRSIRGDTVASYARDMLNGLWVPTHQGIAFNDKDELIDGQHRLHAIILSNVTVRTMVTFGLPSVIEGKEMKTMDAVDRGPTRSVADQLTIQHGFKNGTILASVCNALASLCFGERTRRLSVGQTLDVFREFEPAVLYVIERRSKQHGLRTQGVLAGFAFALMPEYTGNKARPFWDNDTKLTPVAEMFERLNQQERDTPATKKLALTKLREFLTSDEAKLFTRSLDRGLAELTLQAIHLERQGKPCDKLLMVLDGASHYSSLQKARVEKIASLFKLPK